MIWRWEVTLKGGAYPKNTPVFKFNLIPNHDKVYIFRKLKDQKLMEKYFCALELYCNLTQRLNKSATCCSMPGLTWQKITPARTNQKESFKVSKEDK